MTAKSSLQGSAAASEIHVYIQDDNHDKKNNEDQDNIEKIFSKKRVNSQELQETLQKKKGITPLPYIPSKNQLLVNKLLPSFAS